MDQTTELRLGHDLIDIVGDWLAEENIQPDDPALARIFACLLATHYILRKGDVDLLADIISTVAFTCAQAAKNRKSNPTVIPV